MIFEVFLYFRVNLHNQSAIFIEQKSSKLSYSAMRCHWNLRDCYYFNLPLLYWISVPLIVNLVDFEFIFMRTISQFHFYFYFQPWHFQGQLFLHNSTSSKPPISMMPYHWNLRSYSLTLGLSYLFFHSILNL